MERIVAKVGDTVWVYGIDTRPGENDLRPVKVVHVFEMYGDVQYVIEIDTPVDPVLEVRSEWSVSDSPDKPIGLYRRIT